MSVHDEVLAAAKDMLRLNLTAGTSGNVSGRIADNHIVIAPEHCAECPPKDSHDRCQGDSSQPCASSGRQRF